MEIMYSNAENPRTYFGYLATDQLDFRLRGDLPHDTRDLLFIPSSLVKADKYIEVSDRNFVIAKQTWLVQIKMCEDNGKPFIATLYNVLFVPDLWDQIFSIIKLMNLGHN